MFDVGFSELVLLAIVALVVLGPEKLPHAARMAGAWLGRLRRSVINIQAEIEKEVAAQEMRDRIEKEIARLKSSEVAVNREIQAVENTIRQAVADPEPQAPVEAALPAPDLKIDEVPETPAETAPAVDTPESHAQPTTPAP